MWSVKIYKPCASSHARFISGQSKSVIRVLPSNPFFWMEHTAACQSVVTFYSRWFNFFWLRLNISCYFQTSNTQPSFVFGTNLQQRVKVNGTDSNKDDSQPDSTSESENNCQVCNTYCGICVLRLPGDIPGRNFDQGGFSRHSLISTCSCGFCANCTNTVQLIASANIAFAEKFFVTH